MLHKKPGFGHDMVFLTVGVCPARHGAAIMCDKCGCSDTTLRRHDHASASAHGHAYAHTHEAAELSHNDRLAERNRGFFLAKRVFVVNLLSFSGSGAHAFVERTVADYGQRRCVKAVTPDFLESIHASHDHHAAVAASNENIHLDAHGIAHALAHLDLDQTDVVLLENGGSAASQAVYDLGASARVALFSVRDGEFKPLKFPLFFDGVAAVVINEIDQIAATRFDLAKARAHVAQVAPDAQVLEVASATGAGMEAWYAFLDAGVKQAKA